MRNAPRVHIKGTTLTRVFSTPQNTQGADSASYCKCEQNFYDFLSGGADGPECSACPSGGFSWAGLGAISVAACSCPAGFYLNDAVSGSCTACAGGTYKVTCQSSVLSSEHRTAGRRVFSSADGRVDGKRACANPASETAATRRSHV